MNKIPFSIELYNTGEYDVVRGISENTPVEILTTNARGNRPLLVYVGNDINPSTFSLKGCYYSSNKKDSTLDLFLIEKVTFEDRFFNIHDPNVYEEPISGGYEDLLEAEECAGPGLLSHIKLRIFSNGDVEILETIKNNS